MKETENVAAARGLDYYINTQSNAIRRSWVWNDVGVHFVGFRFILMKKS